MCIVTWTVSSPDFDVDAFLARFPSLEVDNSWHRGDVGVLKRVREDSGFSLTLHDGENPSGAVQSVRRALDELVSARDALAVLSVQSELRFGLYVGAKDSFVPTLAFTAEDLHYFGNAALDVVVLGYPVSDEP